VSDDGGIVFARVACCGLIAKLDHPGFVHGAALGPGDDEITVLDRDAVRVYGRDGAVRRSAEVLPGKTFADVAFDTTARHALVWQEGNLAALDTVTMAEHTVARDMHGDIVECEDGSTFAYLDDGGLVHVLLADGTPLATIKPSSRTVQLALSPGGDRLAAVAEHEVAVYDRAGAFIRAFSADSRGGIQLRGDDVWTANRDGTIRRYRAGVLVASLPLLVGDIARFEVAGALIAAVGSDNNLVIANALAEQLRVAPPPCDRTQSWIVQIAVLSFCRDGRKLLTVGKHFVGELVQVTDDDPLVSYDRQSGRAAVSTGTLAMYGADGKLLAVAKHGRHFGDVAIEDADHVLALDTPTGALWRWTWATDRLDKLVPVEHALAVAVTAGGVMISYRRTRDPSHRARRARGVPRHVAGPPLGRDPAGVRCDGDRRRDDRRDRAPARRLGLAPRRAVLRRHRRAPDPADERRHVDLGPRDRPAARDEPRPAPRTEQRYRVR
jgi:hypothetical protein